MPVHIPPVDDVEDVERLLGSEYGDDDGHDDMRTPLDKTIDRIGMGTYQWTLFSLCGFGWMADSMWIQAVAIILPRVQQHYAVPDNYIGIVSSSMFAGMMFGAIGWGTCSDLMGRSAAFNATLFLTSLFGLLTPLANSFSSLCIFLFLLGSAVGGSMPTDGTLILEYVPKRKQYLVTALSVFFSFGAVLSAVVGLLVIPRNSCGHGASVCNQQDNWGWKYMLVTLSIITFFMFLARMVFFRLHESPRYLVHAGRHREALQNLQLISKFNGSELELNLKDVDDRRASFLPSGLSEEPASYHSQIVDGDSAWPSGGVSEHRPNLHNGESSIDDPTLSSTSIPKPPDQHFPSSESPRPRSLRHPSTTSLRSSIYQNPKSTEGLLHCLPRWLSKPFYGWRDRLKVLLGPEWFGTTVLMWAVWFGISLAYTMFNVFLPKLLESRSAPTATAEVRSTESSQLLEKSLWDVVIFTIGACPGSLVGAYMVESRLGRRWSLAGSTFMTAFFCVVFVHVSESLAVRASTVVIGLSSMTMWAVLYGWTPDLFGTKVRGTACGTASALSRIGGMIAPLLGGVLLTAGRPLPVYASVVVFVIAGICVLTLKENVKGEERIMVH